MNAGASLRKNIRVALFYGVIACVALSASPDAPAAPVWGAQAAINVSTCGGEVLKSHSLDPLGLSGVDVTLDASQLSCGGMYGYAGDTPYANVHAVATLSTGTVGIYARARGLGTYYSPVNGIIPSAVALATGQSAFHDLLSFTVPAHTPGTITFTTTVNGSYTPYAANANFSMGGNVTCTSSSCYGQLSGQWDGKNWSIDNGGGTTLFFTRIINIADSAQPFTFDYLFSMGLGVSAQPFAGATYDLPNVTEGTADFLHTAALGYTLPAGVSFTSASNQFLAGPAAVPVPATVWLFGSGLLGLIGVARRTNTGR